MGQHGVHIRWASRYDYERGKRLSPHSHTFYQLIYFVDGRGSFMLDEKTYTFSPGSFFLIAPQVVHGFVSSGIKRAKTLDIKFEIVEEQLEQIALSHAGACMDEGSRIKQLLEQIRHEGESKNAYFDAVASLLLAQLLYELARQKAQSLKGKSIPEASAQLTYEPQEAAHKLKHYAALNYAKDITLEDAASHVGYNKSYLGRVFRLSYGCTFTQYVRKLRIQKAKELIAETDISLKTISWQVGFKTIYHFTRVFKELEGISPGEWRQKEQAGIRKDIYFLNKNEP